MTNKIDSDNLIVNNIYAESIKNNGGIKLINKKESINRYFNGETILPYEWAPDYENTFSMYGVSAYTAQASGWISIDRTSSDSASIFINDYIANTFSNTGSLQLFVSKGDIISSSSDFDFTFSPCISDSKISFDFNATPYDIWSGIPVKTDEGMIHLKNFHIPNASVWNIKIREANNLNITSISDNKAFDGDKFICNIQFEKIEIAENLFSRCQNLTSFNANLSLLKDAPGMFFNCNLDAQSVENILSSLSTYDSGEHNITLTIQESAKETFQQITGSSLEMGQFYNISFKGWNIDVFLRDNRYFQTPYDIYKDTIHLEENGSLSLKSYYIPDASKWNSEIYHQYNLNITAIENNMAYNGSNFVCNIQSQYIENGTKLFHNCYNLSSFKDPLTSLVDGNSMFLNCEKLTDFECDLSSLSDGTNMFIGCMLNSASIEKILTTIPTYTTGSHKLGLTLLTIEEANKFNEITGASVEIGNIYNIEYKGWTITTYIAKDDREIPTKYDIWKNVISLNKETTEIEVVDLYLPDASKWNSEIYNNFKLRITKVEENKAYNGSDFVCNIQSQEIVNGDNLFNDVATLTTFVDNLSSLSSGVNMFNGCSLDVISVENILTSIPTYTSGEHILTMRIKVDAVEKFIELTGINEIGEEISSVSFKGWTIQVGKITRIISDYDIWEGTPYIPDASSWRTNVYDEHGLIITDIRDNKIYNGDEFVCNIQCESIENIELMEGEDLINTSPFSNNHLKSVTGDFSSLKTLLFGFSGTDITDFSGNLSSLSMAFWSFNNCTKLNSFTGDTSSLLESTPDMLIMQSLVMWLMYNEYFIPFGGSFSQSKITSFNSNLDNLVVGGGMFYNCKKLTSFQSNLSSLGNFGKLFDSDENLKLFGEMPAPYPPQTEEDIAAWNDSIALYGSTTMFLGCNLDAESVRHILNTLPSYNDGIERPLGLSMQPEAAIVFGEITGVTPTQYWENMISSALMSSINYVPYKGWQLIPYIISDEKIDVGAGYNIPSGTTVIENWPLSQAGLSAGVLYDNYLLIRSDTTSFNPVAYLDFDSVEVIRDMGMLMGIGACLETNFPELTAGYGLFAYSEFSFFDCQLRNLKFDMMGFWGCANLSYFNSSLHSLVVSAETFSDCTSLTRFDSDLRSLCFALSMFDGCESLTSFTSKLHSLGDYQKSYQEYLQGAEKIMGSLEGAPTLEEFIVSLPIASGMFSGCQLDAASVENILTSIPEWNDGYYRELGMTIQSGEAAEKFGEITGIIPASTEEVDVPFKGWNIKVNLYSV